MLRGWGTEGVPPPVCPHHRTVTILLHAILLGLDLAQATNNGSAAASPVRGRWHSLITQRLPADEQLTLLSLVSSTFHLTFDRAVPWAAAQWSTCTCGPTSYTAVLACSSNTHWRIHSQLRRTRPTDGLFHFPQCTAINLLPLVAPGAAVPRPSSHCAIGADDTGPHVRPCRTLRHGARTQHI